MLLKLTSISDPRQNPLFDNIRQRAKRNNELPRTSQEEKTSGLFSLEPQQVSIDPFIPCFRCGVCCSRYRVRVDFIEARRIADELGLPWHEFARDYLQQHHPGATTFLLRQDEGVCVFLRYETQGRSAMCAIHPFKPSACRDWVPSLYRRECREGLVKVFGVTVNSVGQLVGNYEAIQALLSFIQSAGKDAVS